MGTLHTVSVPGKLNVVNFAGNVVPRARLSLHSSSHSLRDNRSMTSVHPRITIESDKRDGKPCVRGMRITVNDVLGWLAHGMTEEEILEEHPGLEKEDFAAVYAFAADVADTAYGGR